LFDNGRRSKANPGRGKRPLKSLSDMLKRQAGRFRQNLLVSGWTTRALGDSSSVPSCACTMRPPKAMAVELFKPSSSTSWWRRDPRDGQAGQEDREKESEECSNPGRDIQTTRAPDRAPAARLASRRSSRV